MAGAVRAVGNGAGTNDAERRPGGSAGQSDARALAPVPVPASAEVSPSAVVTLSGAGLAASKGLGEVLESNSDRYNAFGLFEVRGRSRTPFRARGSFGAGGEAGASGPTFAELQAMNPEVVAFLLMLVMDGKSRTKVRGLLRDGSAWWPDEATTPHSKMLI